MSLICSPEGATVGSPGFQPWVHSPAISPMPQSYVCLHYHLIFSTRHREPVLADSLRPQLYQYVGGILRAERSKLHASGGTADHTHWLVSLHQGISVADALRTIKACSSKWIHETFPEMRYFAWQAGYGAFAVSYSNLAAVERYIEGQADHHRTVTFQEEFLAFLNRHGIPFDERYLWD
jgi:putative transposase